MAHQTPTTEPSAEGPLDLRTAPPTPAVVADLWRSAGWSGATDPDALAKVLRTTESIVNALAGDTRHAVSLSAAVSTAATDMVGRKVVITTAALRDERLAIMQRLGVTTGMGVHEAGHARLDRSIAAAMRKAFPRTHPRAAEAHRLSNIVCDVRLETRTAERYGEFGPLFDLTLWWVAQRYPSGGISALPQSRAQAVNFGLAALRYGPHTVWAKDAAISAERDWWTTWGIAAATLDKPVEHVRAIQAALDHIADLPDEVPAAPMPSPQGAPSASDESGEDEGEGGAGAGQPDEDEDDESEDTEGDESDEAEDQDEDDESDAGSDADEDEDTEDTDADEGAESEGDAGNDEDDESTDADKGDEAGSTGLGGSDPDEGDEYDDEGDEADAEDGEDDGFHHRDETGAPGPDEDEDSDEDAEPQTGPITYGPTDLDPDAEGDEHEGLAQRDALDEPLPLHPQDAVTADDRNRDMHVQSSLNRTMIAERSGKVITVVHEGGNAVPVTVQPLDGKGAAIRTSPEVQGALRSAFTQRKTSRENRDVARSGRLSGARAYRVRAGFDNVFTRRDALAPDRLDVHLLVDASGSMSYSARDGVTVLDHAATVAANLTEALAYVPTVRVHVWAHNTYRATDLWDVYDSRKQQPVSVIGAIKSRGGNNDASAIAALTTVVEAGRAKRERSIIVVISDGAPCEDEQWVRDAVETARTKHIGVVSVAIAGGLTKTQEACYGPTNVVPWTEDWDLLGRGMAQIIGRLAN